MSANSEKTFLGFEYRLHRETWGLALPMILSNLTVPLLGLVDTAVVGHLPSPQYLGGVALGSMVFTLAFWLFGFLRMSTTGLAAQAYGMQDYSALQWLLYRALLLAVLMAVFVLLLQTPILLLALSFVKASVSVEALASEYFAIRIWAVPAVLMRYVLLGWFLGLQNVKATLYVTVFINLLNIVLDIIFVVYLDMAVAGVAWASLIAEYAGLLLGLYLLKRQLCWPAIRWQWSSLWQAQAIKRMLHLNKDIFLRTLLMILAFAFFTAKSAEFGDEVLAANSLLRDFLLLLSFGLDGFAHAAEALVGRAVGKADRRLFWRYVWVSGLWSLLGAVLYTVLFMVAGVWIIALLTNIESVRSLATEYLPWLWLAPLVAVWSYWLDGVFIGATQARAMRNTMFISVCCFALVWYYSIDLGNHGLWLALLCFLAMRGITLLFMLFYTDRHQTFYTDPR